MSSSKDEACCELGKKHSYGFFQNIPDNEWKKFYQQPALAAQHYTNPALPDYRKDAPDWYVFFNWDPFFNCPHLQKVGGLGDGPKWTCDPERISQVAADRSKQSGSLKKDAADCLIYSIGSSGNYMFEDGLYDILAAYETVCEVHIFDPGNFDRPANAGKNMHYHSWGLTSAANSGQGNYYSFPHIQKQLGHQNRTVDIFKIDCEGCEWTTYEDWISADIRQILIETHDLNAAPSKYFDAFKQNGFVLFSKEVNSYWGKGKCSEWSYIKMHPDFFQK